MGWEGRASQSRTLDSMKGQSVRTFALLFSGLGSAAALCLLGSLWLLQRVGGLGLICVVTGQGLMVVSSLMGMLACFRASRNLQLDREEEVRELLGWALCALLVPLVVDVQVALSASLFPQPLIQLAQTLGVGEVYWVLWMAEIGFGALGMLAACTVLYGVSLEVRWTLAYDCLIWLNFLLVLLGQAILVRALHLRRVSLIRNAGIGLEELAGIICTVVGYVGTRAVHTASMLLLRTFVILAMVCTGVGLVASVFGWVAGVRVSTHLTANCFDAMATAHASQLEALECPAKYANFSDSLDTLSCSKPEMRLAWENPLGQDFACLNSTCCSQLPVHLEAVSESLCVQLLGAALAAALASGLVVIFVKQLAYDDKDRFAVNCVFIGMLVSTVAACAWLIFSSPYPSEMTAGPGSHAFSLPETLLIPGGCVSGLRLEAPSCSHCKYTVTTENSVLYEGLSQRTKVVLEGSQQEVIGALGRLVVCPECAVSSMTVLITAEGSSVPQVNSYEWRARTSFWGTVVYDDEPEPEVAVALEMPGCQTVLYQTDNKGRFQVEVPLAPDQSPYNVTLHFAKDGFSTISLQHTIGGPATFKELPVVQLTHPSLLFSSVAVYFFDVVSNTRLSTGSIQVREGYNNVTGPVKDLVTVVDGVGMLEELRPGVYTLVCSSPGLFSDVTEVEVQPNSHQEKAALLSLLQPGLRVVMGWESQRDLDLSVKFAQCWVGFFNKACGDVQLHADNQFGGSSGGEALTFNSLQTSFYYFAATTFRPFDQSAPASLRFYWNSQLPFLRLELAPDSPGLCLDGATAFISAAEQDGNCTTHQLADVTGWVSRPH